MATSFSVSALLQAAAAIYFSVWFLCLAGSAQGQGSGGCPEMLQPVLEAIDPPSGNTRVAYTVTGSVLDEVAMITLQQGGDMLTVTITARQNGTAIEFEISGSVVSGLATLTLVPSNTDCESPSVVIDLREEDVALTGLSSLVAQEGTVIYARGCVPNECGDNSTSYSLTIGGIVLELLDVTQYGINDPTNQVIFRFPQSDSGPFTFTGIDAVTLYNTFDTGAQIRYEEPDVVTSVVPNEGQRGTEVVINGQNGRLDGSGEGVVIAEVLLGGCRAEIVSSSATEIVVRASSCSDPTNAGENSILIQSNQTLEDVPGFVFEGPYLLTDNVWTQLEDGFVSSVVPPAAQAGSTIILCGERLRGGGTIIESVEIAGQASSTFDGMPFPTELSAAGSECVTAVVPDVVVPESGLSGDVTLIANTSAIVSTSDEVGFSYAEIRQVDPNEGQVGTRVVISGVELLSGLNTETPVVYLSGIEATLMFFNSTTIIVQAQAPPEATVGSASASGSGLIPVDPEVYETTGAVAIVVIDTGLVPPLSFNVSLNMAWRYFPPGEILTIFPPFGQYGTRISVVGENLLGFGQTLIRATVNGSEATIFSSNNTIVLIEAPELNGVGFVPIVLFSNTGAQVTGEVSFEYRQRGEIVSISPMAGQYGTFVTITGTNLFGHGTNVSNVTFGDLEAEIDFTATTNASIQVRVPMNDNTEEEIVPVRIVADTSAIVDSDGLTWTYLVQGQVIMASPLQGQEGTRVTVTGMNLLGGGDTVSRIYLDGVPATLGDTVTNSMITVVMQDIANQTDIARGEVFVLANTGAIVTGGQYTHQISGQILAFSPQVGREGTRVTITGNNLQGFGQEITGIEIAGVTGVIESQSNSEVVARAAAANEGEEGPIRLLIDTGAIVSSAVDNAFTYERPGFIVSVSPSEGAEGSGVLISGDALRTASTRVSSITFGGSPVDRIVTETESEISVIAGPAPAVDFSTAQINITANDGSYVVGMTFSYQELAISLPGRTSGQEGTIIEILLPNDDSFPASFDLRAFIDNQEAEITSVDPASMLIEVSVPRASTAGTYTADVAVEGIDRLVARLSNGFTYSAEGVIYTVTPSLGQRGTQVLLQGDNLLGGGDNIISAVIEFPDGLQVASNVDSDNDNVVMLTISDIPKSLSFPSTGEIILTANSGAIIRRLNAFTIVTPGQIDSFSPGTGQFGTYLTISGTDLLQGMSLSASDISVTVAGTEATVQDENRNGVPSPPSDKTILVRVQRSSEPTPLAIGAVEIVLPTGATVTSTSGDFRYLLEGNIVEVSPNTGTAGTRVTITGSNLLGGGSTVQRVLLGGVEAMITSGDSDETVIVTAQEGGDPGAGPSNVEILADTGAIVSGEGLWTYESPGRITSITPIIGQQGVVVMITGESFHGNQQDNFIQGCVLAGVPGEVLSSTNEEVKCRAGYSATTESLTDIVHLVAQSGVAIQSNSNVTFTYYPARIDQIDPPLGSNGTFVSITGVNLLGNEGSNFEVSNITFGNILAAVTEVSPSGDSITARVGELQGTSTGDTVRVTSTSGAYLELPTAWSYSEPGVIRSITPNAGFPGETIRITGENLVPATICVPSRNSLRVILGQTESYNATALNETTVEFRPGVYQGFDSPSEPVPIQIIAPNGATVFTNATVFSYNATGNVTSVRPLAGGAGSEVVITGTELLSGESVASVTLAGYEAMIVSANETVVVVTAGTGPGPGPGTGPGPDLMEGFSGPVVIEANNSRLVGLPGSAWTYLPVILSTSVSPPSGQSGTIVTIENFSRISASDYPLESVTLNGIPANSLEQDSNGTLLLRAGPSDATPVGDIVLQFSSNVSLIIPDAWNYLPPVELDTITPEIGYFNTRVTLTGSNFQAGAVTVTEVTLANLTTEIISQTDSTLEVRIIQEEDSSMAEIVGSVVIRSERGATFTSTTTFRYVQVDIQSVTPNRGQGGTVVTIEGIGLLLGGVSITSVFFDNQQAPMPNSASNSVITIEAPASPMNMSGVNISYAVDSEATVNIPGVWEYVAPGEITGVAPAQGNNGTIVTITGRMMFGGGNQAVTVFLGTVPATEILVNTEVLVQVRAGYSPDSTMSGSSADEELQVTIVADTGGTTSSVVASGVFFEYLEPGEVTSISPMSGQAGTMVTIEGMRLHEVGEEINRVWLAGVQAVVSTNPTMTVITVEAGRPNMQGVLSGPVTIESTRGTLTYSSQDFTYNTEGLILAVTPSQGQTGTRVQITGERLRGGGMNVVAVYLAGVSAEIESESDAELVVIANRSTNIVGEILGDIVIESNTGAVVRRVDGWTYVEPGNVASVSPVEGQFGTFITINGTGLLSGGTSVSTVYVGGIPAYNIVSSNDAEVLIRAGRPNSTDAFIAENFTIVSNFGGVVFSNTPWNYLDQSNVTDVLPNNGTGGTLTELLGTNLLGGGTRILQVTTAGIPATFIDPDSNNTYINFTVGLNLGGFGSTGDIAVTSDSGALTIRQDGWTYEDECPMGQFGNANNCSVCNSECERCFGPSDTECFECSNFRIVFGSTMRCVAQCPNVSTLDNECMDTCTPNQYAETNTILQAIFCRDCNPLCDPNFSCSGPNTTQCGRCLNLYDTTTGSCVETCPNATFIDVSNRCVPCHVQCERELGCDGPTAADCRECRNFIAQVTMIDTNVTGDLCISECGEAFYEENQFCRPCFSECASGCTGSTPYDCVNCTNFAVVSPDNGTTTCVATCNPDPSRVTMYNEMNGICQPCSSLCSLTGGCRGPNATQCISGCRLNPDTSEPLPTLDGECVLSCPALTHYHDRATEQCVACSASCSNGCTGSSSSDCIVDDNEDDEPFSAGVGTIAIVVIIIVVLLVILVLLVAFVVWRLYKYKSYKVGGDAVELGERNGEDRYSRAPLTNETEFAAEEAKSKTLDTKETVAAAAAPVGASNAGFEDGELYTEMSPEGQGGEDPSASGPVVQVTELYTDVVREPTKQSLGSKEAEEQKVTPSIPSRPDKPEEKPPVKPPLALPEEPQGKPPPRPPTPEMYTDMTASVHEVYVNPTADEEYSEMLPHPIADDFYEDAGSVRPPSAVLPPQPTPSSEEKAPLLSSELEYGNLEPPIDSGALYEETDVAIAAAEQYKAATMTRQDNPPELPSRSIPKRRSLTPLPQTPLEKSLSEKAAPPVQDEDLYMETDVPIEESLYEAIPIGPGARLLPDRPEPPAAHPPAKRNGKLVKSQSGPSLPPKPKPRKN